MATFVALWNNLNKFSFVSNCVSIQLRDLSVHHCSTFKLMATTNIVNDRNSVSSVFMPWSLNSLNLNNTLYNNSSVCP